ncbi:quercetin dioxygenase-like cupin family protein [Fontibacillus solani]|uniref:Quercetin dioxygenase-like cupin family protein n=1 Tax=Fontibacillus solani TaxID=1572857 RepID=A0A7W3SVT7_9BACL|nr:cupin domain-containing protein [Fontibacillus solani]MBA9087142.1 quercetin dioxygenase-like cupin family protein [Fontibacillus solani]
MKQGEFIKKLPVSAVIDLKDIITVEDQQVSSLTLVQRPNLAMTLLSLDKGTSIGGHSSPGDAMVNVLSGQTEITIGDDKYTVHTGESIVMPANVPHALYATEAFQMLLVVVKPNP